MGSQRVGHDLTTSLSLSKNERGETMCKSEKKIKDLMAPHVDSEGEGGGN